LQELGFPTIKRKHSGGDAAAELLPDSMAKWLMRYPKVRFSLSHGGKPGKLCLDAIADFDKTYEQTVNSWINPTFDTGMIF
jgi:hypothetical protein